MYQMKVEPTDIFQALADRTRLRVMRILVSMPNEEICLCELTDILEESEPNISRHLKSLRQSGLLSAEKEGRWLYHRLVPSEGTRSFYRLVKSLPDAEGIFAMDLARYKAELGKRTSARCKGNNGMTNSMKRQMRA